MRQFNYFANGGPYPGTCLSCGNNKELFDLGKAEADGSSYLLCTRCIAEIADFTGYTRKDVAVKEIDHMKAHIKDLEQQLKSVPNKVEELINGIRSSVADFVLTVSDSGDGVSVVPVQDDSEGNGKPDNSGKAKNSNNKAPSKSASQ